MLGAKGMQPNGKGGAAIVFKPVSPLGMPVVESAIYSAARTLGLWMCSIYREVQVSKLCCDFSLYMYFRNPELDLR